MESAVARRAQEDKALRTRLGDPVCTAQASQRAPHPPITTCHLSSDLRPGPSTAALPAPAPPQPGLPGPGAGTRVLQPESSKEGSESPPLARDSAKHLGSTPAPGHVKVTRRAEDRRLVA